MSLKELAINVHTGVFIGRDISLLDRHWQEPYLQHNPTLPSGVAALRELLPHILPVLELTVLRVLQDGDIIAFHQRAALSGDSVASFDLYRMQGEKIVEHWDAMQPDPGATPSGRTMFDGTTHITDLHLTEANRRIVRTLIESVFIAGDTAAVADIVAPGIAQHSLRMADGVDALVASLAPSAPASVCYRKLHRVIAEGNFVLSVSEAQGGTDDAPLVVYDLWRVQDAKVAEHWEAIQEIPAVTASGLPMF